MEIWPFTGLPVFKLTLPQFFGLFFFLTNEEQLINKYIALFTAELFFPHAVMIENRTHEICQNKISLESSHRGENEVATEN